jgi:FAD synthetase
MKTVMVFGTFDIIHPGHASFLRQAKSLGDFLIVVVARDNTVRKVKKRRPLFNERQRLRHLRRMHFVNRAVLGSIVDKYSIIARYKPSIIAIGYDQVHFINGLARHLKKLSPKTAIVRLRPYKHLLFKSSLIRPLIEKARNLG